MLGFAIFAIMSAALLLAVLKLAGDAYVHQLALAQANDLVNQSAQISMATRIYRSDGHFLDDLLDPPDEMMGAPDRLLEALVGKGYLNSAPAPLAGSSFQVADTLNLTVAGHSKLFVKVIYSALAATPAGNALCQELNRRRSAQFGCLANTDETGSVFWYKLG